MGAVTQETFNEMVESYEAQAERGNKTAMKLLGDLCYQGPSGTGKNVSLALPWWRKAADCGERSLAHKVGYAYLKGEGCEKDEKRAMHYFMMSADYTDNAESMYTIGLMYENGIGFHANNRKAISYYERAALRGHAQAQWRLGGLLFTAKKSDGLHWICCAHLSGVQEATDALNHFISNGSSAAAINDEIRLIQRDGIDRLGRRHEYNRELSLFLSVLKWGAGGAFVGLLFVLIVCGFMLQMEHFPAFLYILIIALFSYLGYWWEDN